MNHQILSNFYSFSALSMMAWMRLWYILLNCACVFLGSLSPKCGTVAIIYFIRRIGVPYLACMSVGIQDLINTSAVILTPSEVLIYLEKANRALKLHGMAARFTLSLHFCFSYSSWLICLFVIFSSTLRWASMQNYLYYLILIYLNYL